MTGENRAVGLQRAGAFGGVLFVLFMLATFPLSGSMPDPDAKSSEISKWLTDNADGVRVSALCMGLGMVALLWWFGSLWSRMTGAEGGRPQLAVAALSGLLFAAALYSVNGVILSGMAMREAEGGASPVLWAMSGVAPSLANTGVALMVGSVSLHGWLTGTLPRWVAFLGCVTVAVEAASSIGAASDAAVFFWFAGAGFLVWSVWVLGISWQLWKGSPAREA